MAQTTKSSERLFIESLPRSVAPRDVVAKAKAIGLTIKLKKVYRVRAATASPAPSASTKAAPKAAAAVTSQPGAAPPAGAPAAPVAKVSPKAAFILSFPRDTKARDIIAAGAKKGLAVSANYISIVRAGGRKKKAAKGASSAPKKKALVTTAAAPVSTIRTPAAASPSSEKALVDIVLDIGLDRVTAIVADLRKKLEALL